MNINDESESLVLSEEEIYSHFLNQGDNILCLEVGKLKIAYT